MTMAQICECVAQNFTSYITQFIDSELHDLNGTSWPHMHVKLE